jgi:hypothetical protein
LHGYSTPPFTVLANLLAHSRKGKDTIRKTEDREQNRRRNGARERRNGEPKKGRSGERKKNPVSLRGVPSDEAIFSTIKFGYDTSWRFLIVLFLSSPISVLRTVSSVF